MNYILMRFSITSLFFFLIINVCKTQNFITTWQTTTPNEAVTIPTFPGETYNYSVNWGEGGLTEINNTGDVTHTYSNPGTYTITVGGTFPRIYFNNSGDKEKIISIDEWGDIAWTSFESAFHGCTNLENQASDAPDLSNVTSLKDMFIDCTNLTLSTSENWDWNTNTITNFSSMFENVGSFNVSLGDWDIGSATDMANMFLGSVISPTAYDLTLIGWRTDTSGNNSDNIDDRPGGIDFHGGSSTYCVGENARNRLDTNFGWTFTDGNMVKCDHTFTTFWNITSNNDTITIPTTGSGYDYHVSWGDDKVTSHSADASHTYTTSGNYKVRIVGDFPRIYFNNQGESRLSRIDSWGDISWSSFENAFFGCSNLKLNATDSPDLSNVSNMQNGFRACTQIATLPNANWQWDTENITTLQGTFYQCTDFNEDISGWNTQSLESIYGTFAFAQNFNQDISNWDVSNVSQMRDAFRGAIAFNKDISTWDVSSVTNMRGMFWNATSFNQNLEDWDISEVTDMREMFWNATSFNQNLKDWDISKVTDMREMFINTPLSVDNYDATLIGWSILSPNETEIPQNIELRADGNEYCNAAYQRQELIDTYSWTIMNDSPEVNCVIDSSAFVTTWLTTYSGETITIPTIGTGYDFTVHWGDGTSSSYNGMGGNTNAIHLYDIPGTQRISITGDFPRIYFDDSGDKDKILTIEQWGFIEWSDFTNAFMGCSNLEINALDAPDLTGVTSLQNMFRACTTLGQNSFANWTWTTDPITNMSGTFMNANNFNGDIGSWKVVNVSDTREMFRGASMFNQDIGSWKTSSLSLMTSMFYEASNFNQDLSNWNIINSIALDSVFYNATSFDQSLGAWKIRNVASMKDMLFGVTLSTENYDSTFVGWNRIDPGESYIPQNVIFNGGNSIYCTAEFDRLDLIVDYNWTITDGGIGPFCNSDYAFVTTWETTSNNESIAFPAANSTYDITVDWGDGSIETFASTDPIPEVIHNYATPGTYTVKVEGEIFRLLYINDPVNSKLKSIEQWGSIPWQSFENAFRTCNNLELNAQDTPDLSNVISMEGMFAECTEIGQNNNANWDWDVSTIQDMGNLFLSATNFNQDIGDWNMSNVSQMGHMLEGATSFDQNLGNWDISNVVNMTEMLNGASLSLVNYDSTLIGWSTLDTTETIIPQNISFDGGNSKYCKSYLKRSYLIDSLGWAIVDGGGAFDCFGSEEYFITKWQTTGVNPTITVSTVAGEFYNYDIDWDYDGLIFNADATNVSGDITSGALSNGNHQVAIRGHFPRIAMTNSPDKERLLSIDQWGTIQWLSMENAFANCSNLTVPAIDAPDLSNATSMANMFINCTQFNNPVSHWDVSTIENMSGLFRNTAFNYSIDEWVVDNVQFTSSMFRNAIDYDQPMGNWNTANIISMNSMFRDALSFNQDLSNWNVSSVQSFQSMFRDASSFDQNLGPWDIGDAIDMGNMFRDITLSIKNYDATLIGWGQLASGETIIPTGIILNGGDSQYCQASSVRDSLLGIYNWSISDDGQSCLPEFYFVTTWLVGENDTITIPTSSDAIYSYDVDWSYDGITFMPDIVAADSNAISPMLSAGTHTVAIRGAFPRIYFNNSTGADKLATVEQWGTIQWSSMKNAFWGCANFNITNPSIDNPDLTYVTDMENMFRDANNFNGAIGDWDVGKVTNMIRIFGNARNFNQELNDWDVSKVTSMKNMFRDAYAFNQPLDKWDVSSVEKMNNMFWNALIFNQPIESWDVSNVTDMELMFLNARKFNQPLNNWDVGKVSQMLRMFANAKDFNQPLNNWDVSSVRFMQQMFEQTSKFDQAIGDWDLSGLFNMNNIFNGIKLSTTNYDSTLRGWSKDSSGIPNDGVDDIRNGLSMGNTNSQYCQSEEFRDTLIMDYNWSFNDGGLDPLCSESYFILTFEVSENDTIVIPTIDSGYDYDVDWSYDGVTFNAEATRINGDAISPSLSAGVHTVAIQGDFPTIYFFNAVSQDKLRTVEQWGTGKWTTMYRSFMDCSNFEITNTDIDAPDLSNVTILDQMFRGASIFNSDVSHWDVSTINTMSQMFKDATAFNQPLNDWDVSNVEDMGSIFSGCHFFNYPLDNWDVSNVIVFAGMFHQARQFNQSLDQWDVSNGIDFSGMFAGAILYNQPLDAWDVSNAEDLSHMFGGSPYNYPLNSWDVSNVTDMSRMFQNCPDFNQLLDNWNVGNVEIMYQMFNGAQSFNQPLNDWDVDSLTSMYAIFREAVAFNQPLSNWDVSNVSDMFEVFRGATAFDQQLGDWDISAVTSMSRMFMDKSLSTAVYDSTLIGWATLDPGEIMIPTNVSLAGGNSTYCAAESAWNSLDTTYGWGISDNGLRCTSEWTGNLSTDWFDAGNWTDGIPTLTKVAIIPEVVSNLYPIINVLGATCQGLEIHTNANVRILGSGELMVQK